MGQLEPATSSSGKGRAVLLAQPCQMYAVEKFINLHAIRDVHDLIHK